MSRPKAIIYQQSPHGNYIEQIVGCEGVFVVLYDFKPFQLRHYMPTTDFKKYGRSVFVNRAHADRLAKRLNKQHKTEAFTVEQLL